MRCATNSLLSILLLCCGCSAEPARNLVLVSFDTVRRDHLSTYGYARDTSPRLSELAAVSSLFEGAIAQHVNTLPSHASMFTGLHPHVHGSTNNIRPLGPEDLVLAQILRDAGFRTAAFVSGATLRAATGLARGFELYDDPVSGRRSGERTLEHALAWWERQDPGQRHFLFLHFYDAHGPYHPSRQALARFDSHGSGPELPRIPGYQLLRGDDGRELRRLGDYVDRYDALIYMLDEWLGRLVEKVDLSDSVVVVIADHGETLGERYHALDHGAHVNDEQIRIPLLIHAPGLAARRIPDMVQSVDLLPTALELLGIALPVEMRVQGRSLVPLMRGRALPAAAAYSSALALPARHADRHYDLRPQAQIHAIREGRWKLVLYPGVAQDYVELYDLDVDPGEVEDRADRERETRDALQARLLDWLGDARDAGPAPIVDPAQRRYLQQLGYELPPPPPRSEPREPIAQ